MNAPFVFALSVIGTVTFTSTSFAQPAAAPRSPSASPAAASPAEQARAKAKGAKALFEKNKWAEAYEQFAAAEALFHAPPFVLYMARCKRSLGKLTEAATLYKRVITEALPASPPEAFVTAQVDAARELELVKQKIATVHVVVEGAEGREVGLTIDGVPGATATGPIEVDPGKHDVVVTWGSGQTITRSVELLDGEKKDVRVELPAPPKPVVVPPPPPDPNVVKPAEQSTVPKDIGKPRLPPSKVPAIVLLGTGAAGLAVGAISGGYALKLQTDVKAHCDGTNCVRDYEAIANTAKTLAVVSDIGFVAGGLASAGGLIWLVSTMKRQGVEKPKGAFVIPVVSPNGVFLTGAF